MRQSLIAKVLCMLIFTMLSGCYKSQPANISHVSGDISVKIIDWTDGVEESDFDKEMQNEFKKNNPNIVVKRIMHEGDRVGDFETAAANGNAPDMIVVSYPMLNRLADKKLIEPINEYWSDWEESKNFNPQILQHCMIDGKIYGIPGDCYLMGMVYNKRLFEEAGLKEPPKNWEELLEYAKRLTDTEKQQIGFGLLTGEWLDWWFEYFVWQAGGDLTKQGEDGSVVCTFTDEPVIKAAQFYRKLKQERVIDPDLNITNDDIQKKFAEGKIGMTFGTIGDTGVYTKYGMDEEDIGYSVFPVGPAGENPSQFGGNMYSINANSSKEVKDSVFKYMSFLRSKKYLTKKYEYDIGNDIMSQYISIRDDISRQNIISDEETQKVLDEAYSNYRLEYFGKAAVGDYVIEALRNILTDDSADIVTQFRQAQEKAENSLK